MNILNLTAMVLGYVVMAMSGIALAIAALCMLINFYIESQGLWFSFIKFIIDRSMRHEGE